ncbi:MAG: amidohydrolase family protein [Planctomycetes bacterium]|nr:amidohydrolase family protein [Planctomycetota bacterium]
MTFRAALLFVAVVASLPAQGPPHNGPQPVDAGWFALVNARVVTAPGAAPEAVTIVVRDGRIAAVGTDAPPAGATAIDCTGLVVWPGFVEPFYASDVPALDPNTTDQHWNTMVQAQRHALDGALVATADREALRALGFTTVAVAPSGGVLKGTAAVVLLDEPTPERKPRVVRHTAYAAASLQTSRDGYPDSEMGAIALLRQTLLDGRWYERCQRALAADATLRAKAPQPSAALQAVADQQSLPLWFDVQDELQALRTLRIAAEAERAAVVVGSGMEFRRIDALAAAKARVVLPLHFPDAPDVATENAAERVSLRQLQSWEQAPTASKRLLDAGIPIAWTTARLRDRKDFAKNVREAIACGVSPTQALAALTTVPAEWLGIADHCGTIATGKLANFVVTHGELFTPKCEVREVWVGGVRQVVQAAKDRGLDGSWSWLTGFPGTTPATAPAIAITGDKVTVQVGDAKLEVSGVVRDATSLACRLAGKELGDGPFWLRVWRNDAALAGTLTATDGSSRPFRASAATVADGPKDQAKASDEPKNPAPDLGPLPTPLGGYGDVALPAVQSFAIVGCTLWTSDGRGVLRDGALVARDGKIVFAGPRGEMPSLREGTLEINGRGKHVTPGLIDCHSHTGISRGVNEGGQAVTAEVRIEDVLDPDDVNWYRQLAGGVTLVNQLHGSANAIGGQSRTTKNRFGVAVPDAMHLDGAPAGMKWALGENPRRANGSGPNPRYPNTRMGVEALLRDRLAAAIAYRREQAGYEALAPAARARVLPPRRDLELEALAEIVAGTRRVHCHSYRQDEIFMLCGLAKEHGFKIGTFQHVLEGYKVADAIAQNAVGASAFSDWWAFKLEVQDAIPENGAILHEAGVVVSFNSDSNEHARRLNTEAGKAVKYGGVAPHEALCFVTRNPAIQLGIFDRTGSLTAGKDADVVLWSADPLEYEARCEATWVDGRPLFTLARDAEKRANVRRERQRLVQKALAAGKGRTAKEGDKKDAYWAAEDMTQDYCCRDCEGGR